MASPKLMSLAQAISRFVKDDHTLYAAGFTHLIPFAAGHEIIRQGRKNLVLARATPDLIYDQMVAAGCARKVLFSYMGNPGVGSLRIVRSAIERGQIEWEEYSHFGMITRLQAAAAGLPFLPMRQTGATDLEKANPSIRRVSDPYGGPDLIAVPALHPDVAIIHVQRADANGNAHLWGIVGEQKEAAFAAKAVILTTEELVDEAVIRSDPNRTLIPGLVVDAVCHVPHACHPSYAQGYYDRDNAFYMDWDRISQSEADTKDWLNEWVLGVSDRERYWEKLGADTHARLSVKPRLSDGINYGAYYIGAARSVELTKREIWPMPQAIPELELGKVGSVLAFLHANGYPPESYSPLLETFARDFQVRAMFLRPLWRTSKAASLHSWHELTDDFLTWLHQQGPGPVVVVGHSMGAIVALRAALQEPSRFGALVLLDPVLFTPKRMLIWRLVRHLGIGHRLHSAIRRAKKRRAVFRDSNEAFAGYRGHAIFRRLGDHELRQAIRGMLERKDSHLELRYTRKWEARLYFTAVWNDADLWRGLPTLAVPTLIVRGSESDTLTETACAAVRAANDLIQLETIERATHLVPLERPSEVHAVVHRFLQRSLSTSKPGSRSPGTGLPYYT